MTLATMRSAVKTKLRIGSTTDNLLTDTVLTAHVNEALRKVARERPWPWLLTSATVSVSTAGVGTLPTDFLSAHSLVYDGIKVEYVGYAELLAGEYRYAWSENGTQIVVEPAPTATTDFTLHYFQREEALSADGDNPLLPDAHVDLAILWAAHLGALTRRDNDHASMLAVEYDRELASAIKFVFRKAPSGLRVALRAERRVEAARW